MSNERSDVNILIVSCAMYLMYGIEWAVALFVVLYLIDALFQGPKINIRSREDREDDY